MLKVFYDDMLFFGSSIQATTGTRIYVRNRNSCSYEPELELTFVNPVLVEPEPEMHLEIPVPELSDLNSGIFWYKPESQLELI